MLSKYSGSYMIILLFVFQLTAQVSNATGAAASPEVYNALQSNDTVQINRQLRTLENAAMPQKEAYAGALQMKLSGLVKSGMEKLKIFKSGRMKLENSIKRDSLNAEYRFLRLIIQENTPDFMNYHSKLKEDAKFVRESFAKLNHQLQQAIVDYSKRSKILKPEDFQK